MGIKTSDSWPRRSQTKRPSDISNNGSLTGDMVGEMAALRRIVVARAALTRSCSPKLAGWTSSLGATASSSPTRFATAAPTVH